MTQLNLTINLMFRPPTSTRRTIPSATTEQEIDFADVSAASSSFPSSSSPPENDEFILSSNNNPNLSGGGQATEGNDNFVDLQNVREFAPSVSQSDNGNPASTIGQVEASPVLQRFRRQAPSSSLSAAGSDLTFEERSVFFVEERPMHFKGVIQDIQIADGLNVTRIVELFELKLDESANGTSFIDKPETIGSVRNIKLREGVVSDNTCAVNPCQNGGVCQVTWNDYHCVCPDKYKGRNCSEKDFCKWYTCPAGSVCSALADGHECRTNATFNGVNSTALYSPAFDSGSVASQGDVSVISATFRTKSGGTVLQILSGNTGGAIRLSVSPSGKMEIEVPEERRDNTAPDSSNVGGTRAYEHGFGLHDGAWHTIRITFGEGNGVVQAHLDSETVGKQLTLDSNVDLLQFVAGASRITVGSESVRASNRDIYGMDGNSAVASDEVVDIRTESLPLTAAASALTDSNAFNFFRGCIEEVRVSGVLLPFYTEAELVNSTAGMKFMAEAIADVAKGSGCVLCYENECQNGGQCGQPNEVFDCACLEGFQGSTCGENINDCAESRCENGDCVDGIANYTCRFVTK